MSAHKKKNQINLLPQEGFASTGIGRILMWILSSFRIIVIITELIVMSAFLSRFVLDSNNSDLNEELQQKSALIDARSSFEKQFNDTQTNISIIKEITTGSGKESKMLDTVIDSIPPDMFLNTIKFGNQKIEINGLSPSEKSIQQFLVNLGSKSSIEEIAITDIHSSEDNPALLDFTINFKR